MRGLVFGLALVLLAAPDAKAAPGQFDPIPAPKGTTLVMPTVPLSVWSNAPGVVMISAIGAPAKIITCTLPCTLNIPQGEPFSIRFAVDGYVFVGQPPAAPTWKCKGVFARKCTLSPDSLMVEFVKQSS